jgi:integrase
MEDREYLKEIQELRNLSDTTLKRYENDLGHYTKYHQMTLNELLIEAEVEEEERVRMRNRRIKRRLLDFQANLKDRNLEPSTIKTIMSHVKSFYRTYEVELPQIKNPTVPITENIHDIPTIKHIKIATSTNNLKHKALILFMSSSGTGTSETLELTIKDFIIATEDYHNESNIYDVLNTLSKKRDIIPVFTLTRHKINYKYYTFCSPEATEAIVNYLKSRKNINNDSKLFDLTQVGLVKVFKRINDKYQWGWKKNRRFFHAHALRKFFATELTKTGIDHLIIEWMMGHSIPQTTASYYLADPNHLKKEYFRVVNKITVSKIEVYDIKSVEFLKIEKELESNKKEYEQIIQKLKKDFKKEIGDLKRDLLYSEYGTQLNENDDPDDIGLTKVSEDENYIEIKPGVYEQKPKDLKK